MYRTPRPSPFCILSAPMSCLLVEVLYHDMETPLFGVILVLHMYVLVSQSAMHFETLNAIYSKLQRKFVKGIYKKNLKITITTVIVIDHTMLPLRKNLLVILPHSLCNLITPDAPTTGLFFSFLSFLSLSLFLSLFFLGCNVRRPSTMEEQVISHR